MSSEEARQLGCGGSSSEALRRSPPPPGRRGMIPHLLLEHGALGSWSPGRGAAGLGCSRLDPGEASRRRLPVAVAALPPCSSSGRRCRSGGAGAEVAVLCHGWWLQCSFGQPFLVPHWSEEPNIGRQCGRVSPGHTPPKWLSLGPSDTGRCCSIVYWRADGSLLRSSSFHDCGSSSSVCVDGWFILGAMIALHHRCAAPPSQSPISLTQAR